MSADIDGKDASADGLFFASAAQLEKAILADPNLLPALTRLWAEFGEDFFKRMWTPDSHHAGPEHMFGDWIATWCQIVARQYDGLVRT